MSSLRLLTYVAAVVAALARSTACGADSVSAAVVGFTKQHCTDCHNGVDRQGGLDLSALRYAPEDAQNFVHWAKIHDRVQAGEMPPKDAERPSAADSSAFVKMLEASLVAADKQVVGREGRASQRRLNRYEFENAVRDLLHAPWLAVRN